MPLPFVAELYNAMVEAGVVETTVLTEKLPGRWGELRKEGVTKVTFRLKKMSPVKTDSSRPTLFRIA
jgi:hypothetical protein